MNKPICKECDSKGLKYSVIEPMFGTTTLACGMSAYWDEDGAYHPYKDPNHTTYQYSCSNGHQWSETV
jgi:hypothetical protein